MAKNLQVENDLSGKAQWVTDSDGNRSALALDKNGKVGVGTFTPQVTLSILQKDSFNPVGITQHKVGGKSTMELTTSDLAGEQTTRILLRGNTDTNNIEFYRGSKNNEERTMIINGKTGNVGIGTGSNDTDRLLIDGSCNAGSLEVGGSVTFKGITGTTDPIKFKQLLIDPTTGSLYYYTKSTG